jgi:hypothetical protein
MVPARTLKISIVSIFIVINLSAVLLSNFPEFLKLPASQFAEAHFSKSSLQSIRQGTFRIEQYAALTGLNPRWEMFSNVKGPDWRYLIEGICKHGSWPLPLPGQTRRKFIDEYFFDFKEGKFRLNTAKDQKGRQAYARYLCKVFGQYNGHTIEKININIQYQGIRNPQDANQTGSHYEPHIASSVLEELTCDGKQN